MGTLWIGSHMCATQLKRLPGKSFIPRRWVPIFREKFSLKRVWCLKQLLVGLRNLLRGKFCSFTMLSNLKNTAIIEQILNAYQQSGLKVTKTQRVFSFSSHFQKCVQNHCFCITLKSLIKEHARLEFSDFVSTLLAICLFINLPINSKKAGREDFFPNPARLFRSALLLGT